MLVIDRNKKTANHKKEIQMNGIERKLKKITVSTTAANTAANFDKIFTAAFNSNLFFNIKEL